MRIETTYEATEIAVLGPGLASVVTKFQTRFNDPSGSFGFGGAITMTLVERGGRWRILAGHTSSLPQAGRYI